ncbi:ACT domain-containing protein [Paucilactobacillus kaifaensis]|uniref:ACT domain-containing protein n=1 Tax=Paucilactobacillus kaifaensis TaxID=2559921 RepID=UPI0010FA0908|nr:ACT domain-containing protein [Paucilactobacillus kaifaensis]
MKVIITVIGNDKVGIVAAVSQKLAHLNINIIDMSQTLMQGSFTMMLVGDISDQTTSFSAIQEELTKLGTQIDVTIRIQRQELFDAIQKL